MNAIAKERALSILVVLVCLDNVQSKSQNRPPPPRLHESSVGQTFTSSEGQFSIHLPDRPSKVAPRSSDSLEGRISGYEYSWYTSDGIYTISYSEFPFKLDDAKIGNRFLDNLRDKLVSKVHGELQTDRSISIEDYPGREVIIRKSNGALIERIYVVDRRLFQLSIFVTNAANEKVSAEKGAVKVFDSFKLLLKGSK